MDVITKKSIWVVQNFRAKNKFQQVHSFFNFQKKSAKNFCKLLIVSQPTKDCLTANSEEKQTQLDVIVCV